MDATIAAPTVNNQKAERIEALTAALQDVRIKPGSSEAITEGLKKLIDETHPNINCAALEAAMALANSLKK
jgi:hypothetical protein